MRRNKVKGIAEMMGKAILNALIIIIMFVSAAQLLAIDPNNIHPFIVIVIGALVLFATTR